MSEESPSKVFNKVKVWKHPQWQVQPTKVRPRIIHPGAQDRYSESTPNRSQFVPPQPLAKPIPPYLSALTASNTNLTPTLEQSHLSVNQSDMIRARSPRDTWECLDSRSWKIRPPRQVLAKSAKPYEHPTVTVEKLQTLGRTCKCQEHMIRKVGLHSLHTSRAGRRCRRRRTTRLSSQQIGDREIQGHEQARHPDLPEPDMAHAGDIVPPTSSLRELLHRRRQQSQAARPRLSRPPSRGKGLPPPGRQQADPTVQPQRAREAAA